MRNKIWSISTSNSSRSIVRVVSILRSFTPNEFKLSAPDISRKVGVPKTTTYRMLSALTSGGLLEQDRRGKHRIGPELYILGSLYLSTTGILKAAEPVVKTLNELTGEAVNVGMLDKQRVIYNNSHVGWMV